MGTVGVGEGGVGPVVVGVAGEVVTGLGTAVGNKTGIWSCGEGGSECSCWVCLK